MYRLCMGCARAGLIQGTSREWLVAIKVRAGGVFLREASKDRGRWWNTRKHDAVHEQVWV